MGISGLSLLPSAGAAAWPANKMGKPSQSYSARADKVFSTDSASITSAAREQFAASRLLNEVTSLEGLGAGRQYKTLTQVGADLAEDLSAFQQTFSSFMAQSGINTDHELVLQGDGQGHVKAVNDHPDQERVNNFFNHNNPMVARFMVAAARASLVDAGQGADFRSQYESDPVAAIKTNIDALKEKMLGFQMHFGAGGLDTSFASPI